MTKHDPLSSSPIPLVDVAKQNKSIASELNAAVEEVVSASQFVGGRVVDDFTGEFAKFCNVKHAVGCGNGTDALQLAILATLGRGDGRSEIITVSHTFAATVEAIVLAGYRPVMVDVDPATYLMDLDAMEDAFTARTVAVVPVHLYGQMVDMQRLMDFASRRNIAVVEDAAQAHGARRDGVGPGQRSHAASFSFFPGKNLGAWGDAGAVVTNHPEVAATVAQLADHGRSSKYTHEMVGVNSRLDAIQAAVLRVKLRHLPDWTAARRRAAHEYDASFAENANVQLPVVASESEPVYHLYVIQADDRDALGSSMRISGIATGIHYPIPVHEQPAYASYSKGPGSLPNTHALCGRILSLPIFPELTPGEAQRVVDAVRRGTSAVDTGGAVGSVEVGTGIAGFGMKA